MINKETVYTKDLANKKVKVTREFDAPVEQVWKAWTEPELLGQWWAPKPWKAVTQSMDFRPGGTWFYYMQGPDNERHYCKLDYETITPNKFYSGVDAFCDEKGNVLTDMPSTHWNITFNQSGNATKVEVELNFASEAELERLIEMGFREGFASAHNNLDEVLAK